MHEGLSTNPINSTESEQSYPSEEVYLDQFQMGLIEDNLPLVLFIANQVDRHGMELEDIVQEGCIGLIQAASRFDTSMPGSKFTSWATTRIKGAIIDAQRKNDPLSRDERKAFGYLYQAETELMQEFGRLPTVAESSSRGDILPETADFILAKFRDYTAISLDQPYTLDDGAEITLVDNLPDGQNPSADDSLEQIHGAKHINDLLDEREKKILCLAYLYGYSISEIGAFFGVTQSRISQIRTGALTKLGDERPISSESVPIDEAA